jgi:hypothetical protein
MTTKTRNRSPSTSSIVREDASLCSTCSSTGKRAVKVSRESTFAKKTVKGSIDHLRESYILKSLVPPYCVAYTFLQLCKQHIDILGGPGHERKKSRNRRTKLLQLQRNNYESFRAHCLRYNIVCPETLEECERHRKEENKDEYEEKSEDLITTMAKNPFKTKFLLNSTPHQGDEEDGVGKSA